MRTTIAIPTYKNYAQLSGCLWTLTNYVEHPYRIIVVNNGPPADPDGVKFEEGVRRVAPAAQVIQAPENLGWAKAINLAFEEAEETELFCMANDDLVFVPYHRKFLTKMCQYFQYPEVGAVGPSSNFVAGAQSIFDHRAGALCETSLLIGFFLVIRSDLFGDIGGLDESLPGGDDLDLSILVRKRNMKMLIERTSFVHHIGQQTGRRLYDWWDGADHQNATNDCLIRKHGVRQWYETIMARTAVFKPATQTADQEGDLIRSWVVDLEEGLDVGCGSNKTVPRATGVDLTPRGDKGQAGGQRGKESEADLCADVCDVPLPAGSQDYIIARHILEHLVDPLGALIEWRRLLKPWGVLALACPDHDRCDSIALDCTHVHAFTPSSLRRVVEAVGGFQVEEVVRVQPGMSFCMLLRRNP